MLSLFASASCSGGDGENQGAGTGAVPADTIIRRDKASAYYALQRYPEAAQIMLPLVERQDAQVQDLVRAASIQSRGHNRERSKKYLDRAIALAPDDAAANWGLHHYWYEDYELDLALAHIRKVLEVHPDDIPSRYALARTLKDLGDPEAAEHYEFLIAQDPDYAGSWLVSSCYSAARYYQEQERDEDYDREMTRYEAFVARGVNATGEIDRFNGNLGGVQPGAPGQLGIPAPLEWTASLATSPLAPLAGTAGLREIWQERALINDKSFERVNEEGKPRAGHVASWPRPSQDLLAFGANGLWHLSSATDMEPVSVLTGSILAVASCDLPLVKGNKRREEGVPIVAEVADGFLDLLVAQATESGSEVLQLYRTEEWTPLTEPVFTCAETIRSLIAVDYDHDGDVDCVVSHGDKTTLLRNDGVAGNGEGDGRFTPTEGIPWPAGEYAVRAEDLDGDNDLDFVLMGDGEAKPAIYLSSERSKGFLEAPDQLPSGIALDARRTLFDDIDQDGRQDLVIAGEGIALYFRTVAGNWIDPVQAGPEGGASATGAPIVVDWDLDGTSDVLWPAGDRVHYVQAAGFDVRQAGTFETGLGEEILALHAADIDGDFAPDLLLLTDSGLHTSISASDHRGLLLELLGDKDNQRGVGATVELRAQNNYRRIYWRGEPMLLSLGAESAADILRITWPNGVTQTEADLGGGEGFLIKQAKGLVGSCPFLYTWNGETYEYISDVIGITPLGLPMGNGQLVPPDHDEYVLVRGEQMAPKDGFFEMQFTEELREVTYLDRIRLDVVDHPADVEIYPNERFTFPPFPEAHTHSVKDALEPLSAMGSDGKDWTEELSKNDETFAVPFEAYDGQYLGLATPHWIELAFDPERVAGAKKLRLIMNGWFFWTDASVNMAAGAAPGIDFIPPLLQVPDGNGGWIENGPPLGFPAGKLKTMVIDVTGRIDPTDPRFRIFGSLRLYWDSIRLAVDDDDAELRVTQIEPSSALLWERGFSQPIPTHGELALDWFDWDVLAEEPRWNQHPGLYTRFGECVPLLGEVDDRFVIMGSGDALRVRFPAEGLPELPEGWRRDYLVYLDGWAKDRDPNSHEAEYVEPLPFHGMSAYPYPADEHFPDTEEHRAWRREWNTRPAKRWIPQLEKTARTPAGIAIR